jgi:hypothetical protein
VIVMTMVAHGDDAGGGDENYDDGNDDGGR